MSMDKDIKTFCLKQKFNGVVLIAKGEKIIFFESFGYKNIEDKIPLNKETFFRIGSITKQFTAMAILQLVDKRILKLTDYISTFIANVPYGQEVTIHQLLSNSSGIPNFDPFSDYSKYLKSDNFHKKMVEDIIFSKPLNFTPGEKFEYSSSGFFILTYLIELLTKKSYSEYLKENIFLPLDMIHSGFCFIEDVIPEFASLYDIKNDSIVKAEDIDMRIASGGGGLYSNALDLHRWNQALIKSELLPLKLQEAMFSVQTPINDSGGYGYGVVSVVLEKKGELHKFVYHPGNGPGVYAQNTIIDNDIQLIMLSNINDKITFRKCYDEVENLLVEKLLPDVKIKEHQ